MLNPTHIVIHHSLTKDGKEVSWGAIREYHVNVNKWKNIGYHFGVELVNNQYEILVGRLLDEDGAHCKEGGMNKVGIGICVVGNFDTQSVPPEQLNLLIQLTQSLMSIFKIPKSNVKRHTDFAPYKSCPGNKFQWGEFIGRLN
jgi:hypothetical protein